MFKGLVFNEFCVVFEKKKTFWNSLGLYRIRLIRTEMNNGLF